MNGPDPPVGTLLPPEQRQRSASVASALPNVGRSPQTTDRGHPDPNNQGLGGCPPNYGEAIRLTQQLVSWLGHQGKRGINAWIRKVKDLWNGPAQVHQVGSVLTAVVGCALLLGFAYVLLMLAASLVVLGVVIVLYLELARALE